MTVGELVQILRTLSLDSGQALASGGDNVGAYLVDPKKPGFFATVSRETAEGKSHKWRVTEWHTPEGGVSPYAHRATYKVV